MPSGLLQHCGHCWEPGALYCVLMLNTEVVVMEPRLMFCSRDRERETEKRERSLSLSLSGLSAGMASWGVAGV